jgi:hypothetical protein
MESEFLGRARRYFERHAPGTVLGKKLGAGQEGFVWESTRGTALKVFERESNFNRELKCYEMRKRLLVLTGLLSSQLCMSFAAWGFGTWMPTGGISIVTACRALGTEAFGDLPYGHDLMPVAVFLRFEVPRTGFEPARGCPHNDLNVARLPISPPGQS